LVLVELMEAALGGKVRPVKWAPHRSAAGRADVPYVAATRKTATGVDFDIYLVPIAPQPIPVKDKMLTIDQMFFKDQSAGPLTGVLLMGLVKEMGERNATRLPVLDHGRAISIVHKSTINEFLVKAIASGDVSELTLQDLLDEHAEALRGPTPKLRPTPRSRKRARRWPPSQAAKTSSSSGAVGSSAGYPTCCSFRTNKPDNAASTGTRVCSRPSRCSAGSCRRQPPPVATVGRRVESPGLSWRPASPRCDNLGRCG